MITKHTPGPWKPDGYGLRVLAEPKHFKPTAAHPVFVVAQCSTFCNGTEPEERANAARIVACVNACEGINPEAVPDVVKALEELLSLDSGDSGTVREASVRDAARAALAKARTP